MWRAVPTAHWNHVVGTDWIWAVDTGQGCSDRHVTISGWYRLEPDRYRPPDSQYWFPLEPIFGPYPHFTYNRQPFIF
jgi:hypothetical protein